MRAEGLSWISSTRSRGSGSKKRRGSAPGHYKTASGSIARHILQARGARFSLFALCWLGARFEACTARAMLRALHYGAPPPHADDLYRALCWLRGEAGHPQGERALRWGGAMPSQPRVNVGEGGSMLQACH